MSDPLPAGSLDDQSTARLLHQRIIVPGQEVDDQIANRLCAEPGSSVASGAVGGRLRLDG